MSGLKDCGSYSHFCHVDIWWYLHSCNQYIVPSLTTLHWWMGEDQTFVISTNDMSIYLFTRTVRGWEIRLSNLTVWTSRPDFPISEVWLYNYYLGTAMRAKFRRKTPTAFRFPLSFFLHLDNIFISRFMPFSLRFNSSFLRTGLLGFSDSSTQQQHILILFTHFLIFTPKYFSHKFIN